MPKSWKVESQKGGLVELERDGEFLEITIPIETGARLIFLTLRVGQIVEDDMVRILTGKAHSN
jgi:hypothetical protein